MKARNLPGRSRLPGVYFQTTKPSPGEILPRMDIAAFVGFAAAGPQQTPVPVEDLETFHQIFGDTLDLAWDRETGQMQTAHLTPTVEAFFQNGGKRCWVVRAANDAVSNQFTIPGLIRAGDCKPELACARSGGSWSDHYRVGSHLNQLDIGEVQQLIHNESVYCVSLSESPVQLKQGDLLRLISAQRILFLFVDQVSFDGNYQTVICPDDQVFIFRKINPEFPGLDEMNNTAEIHRPGCIPTKSQCQVIFPLEQAGSCDVLFKEEPDLEPRFGDILHITQDDGQNRKLLLPVVESLQVEEKNDEPDVFYLVKGGDGYWISEATQEEEPESADQDNDLLSADLLSFSLTIWQEQERLFTLDNLSFSNKHSHFWADLPTDEALFDPDPRGRVNKTPGSLAALAYNPRFPLAGPEDPDEFYLPIGMPFLPAPSQTTAALGNDLSESRLQRDGLKEFSWELFLHESLKSLNCQRLPGEVYREQQAFLEAKRKSSQASNGQKLKGLHSLWNLEEVTLIAVPDAVQREWEISKPALPDLLAAPVMKDSGCIKEEFTEEGCLGNVTLAKYSRRFSWSSVPGAEGYTLQEDSNPDFKTSKAYYLKGETGISIPMSEPCPELRFYRVRAEAGAKVSPWSNTCLITCPESSFVSCSPFPPLILQLEQAVDDQEQLVLQWKFLEWEGRIEYILEKSEDPGFHTANRVNEAPKEDWEFKSVDSIQYGEYEISPKKDGIAYYRIRALQDGRRGPWSNTVVITNPPGAGWAMVETADYQPDHLLAVQRAMLSFCSARGDVFSVLSMPFHYRFPDVLEHIQKLQATVSGTTAALETRDLSFGALYHPWLTTRTTIKNGSYLTIPSDGAVCGMAADISLTKGAWVAPANIPIKDAVSLSPHFDLDEYREFYSNQVNFISPTPRGFLVMSAATICPDRSLVSINVRRLLSLLRRLAMREGRTFVFESSSAAFRRRVKYHFEGFLEQLFYRGAFAGKSTKEAYRVLVDDTLNSPSAIDRGRFVIELQVAPSEPLVFLIVRLVQQESGRFVVREI